MAAGNYNRKVSYYNISKGKFVNKKKGSDEKTYYEYVSGLLTLLKIEEAEFEGEKYKLIVLNLYDGGENYIVNIPFNSGYGRAFCKSWENVDLAKPIELSASYKKEEGKRAVTSLFIMQNNKPTKWYYKKDDYKDLPQPTQNEITGKWDYSLQEKFFLDKLQLLSNTLQEIMDDKQMAIPFVAEVENHVDAETIQEAKDDLPF